MKHEPPEGFGGGDEEFQRHKALVIDYTNNVLKLDGMQIKNKKGLKISASFTFIAALFVLLVPTPIAIFVFLLWAASYITDLRTVDRLAKVLPEHFEDMNMYRSQVGLPILERRS